MYRNTYLKTVFPRLPRHFQLKNANFLLFARGKHKTKKREKIPFNPNLYGAIGGTKIFETPLPLTLDFSASLALALSSAGREHTASHKLRNEKSIDWSVINSNIRNWNIVVPSIDCFSGTRRSHPCLQKIDVTRIVWA